MICVLNPFLSLEEAKFNKFKKEQHFYEQCNFVNKKLGFRYKKTGLNVYRDWFLPEQLTYTERPFLDIPRLRRPYPKSVPPISGRGNKVGIA